MKLGTKIIGNFGAMIPLWMGSIYKVDKETKFMDAYAIDVKWENGSITMGKLEIGAIVSFINEVGDKFTGELSEVSSDFYDDVKLEDGVVTYWSKKTKKYVPVKEKNKESIFFVVKTALGLEFVTESELF